MTSAAIKIDGVLGSREDLTIGVAATLTNNDNTGVVSWAWTFVSIPPGSAATIVNPTSATATFTPDVVGSYLINLVVSDGLVTYSNREVGAVDTTNLSIRIPAVNEEDAFDSTNGWGGAIYSAFNTLDSYAFKLRGRDVSSTTPTNGYALIWNGVLSQWEPTELSVDGYVLHNEDISTSALIDGYVLVWNSSANIWSPQIQDGYKIQGRNVASTAPTDGYALIWNGVLSQWEPTELSVDGYILHNEDISTSALIDGYILVWNALSNIWSPQIQDAYMLYSRNVASTAPTDGYALIWNATSSQWEPTELLVDGYVLHNEDVSTSALVDGNILVWSTSNNQWQPEQPADNNTLNQSYNQGGAGAGRSIFADTGPVYIDGYGVEALSIDGYVGIKAISIPTHLSGHGLLYVKNTFDGYSEYHNELFYKDNYGQETQVTFDGYLSVETHEEEFTTITGAETSLVLTRQPKSALDRRSGYAVDVYRNGILMRYVSVLAGDLSTWTYTPNQKRVSWVAPGASGNWYMVIYH